MTGAGAMHRRVTFRGGLSEARARRPSCPFFPNSRGWLWLRELIPPHANRGRAVVPITGAAARDAIQIRDIRHEGERAAFEAICLVEGGLGLFAISGHVASIRRSLGQSGSSRRWALDRTRAIGTG